MADFFLGILCIGTAILAVTFIRHLFFVVPFVPTPMRIVDAMLDVATLKGDETIYDLGAGDARFLVRAKERFPNVTAKGCELVWSVWALGKVRIWWSGKDVTLRWQNALTMDVGDADVICLYLLPWMLESLGHRLDGSVRPGTRVLSHTFQFPGRVPLREVEVGKKRVYLYEW